MPQRRDVVAAGAVVFRPRREVLLVHRPRYDDWSFPKGKLDPGEHAAVAGVREVNEETGVHVRLGPPLADQRYPVSGGRHKLVHYWVGWPVGDDDVSGYHVNDEIDEVCWLPYDDAVERLTYDHDRATLAEAKRLRKRSHALVVLRHAKARSRKGWTKRPDQERPLIQLGHDQAQRLVALLAAYDATRVVSSASTRCVQTVQPYADTTGWELTARQGLTEEGATDRKVAKVVADLLAGSDGAVVCTHRPVLPAVWDALGVPAEKLEPAGMVIVHHRKGAVVATEVHQRP
jgi:8-oxo-dGTP pyrophosphatase MutT (NUDIX family)/phosphohistidine phosphatase SixA